MKMHTIIAVLALAVMGLSPIQASAQGAKLERIRAFQREWEPKADAAAATLMRSSPNDWTVEQQEEYLEAALQVVFWGINSYIAQNHRHPTQMSDLADFIADIPRNPYDAWRPMELSYSSTSFSAGNLFVQVTQDLSYAGPRPNKARISYALGIFGPDESFQPSESPSDWLSKMDKFGMRSWITLPTGTAFITLARRPSAHVVDEATAQVLAETEPVN